MTTFNPDKPFDNLPLLPPAADIETKSILKKTTAAARALSELKSVSASIPNPLLLVGSIPLLEAKVSSEIENIVTTSDDLFQFAADEHADALPATKEAYRYSVALKGGFAALNARPLSVATATLICQTLRGAEIQVRKMPGTIIADPSTRKAIYTPPSDPERLKALLRNWEQYVNEPGGADHLIKMAVMHYQFEAIHPFTDGNGRTGRILNILYLVQHGLLALPVLYLSRYILENRQAYYRHIRAVTERGAWEPWILYMLDAIEVTATWTSRRILAVQELLDHTREHLKAILPGIYTHELLELMFSQPYIRIGNLIDSGIAARDTASSYLRKLAAAGVLAERKKGRTKLFQHTKLLNLLLAREHTFEKYSQHQSKQ
ncbi:MAG: Fic family protein [Candidatus Hydrogenedentes bacterium]|nr:Fic family protein [Candidatus Hydrogenedentota bacterium]